jgi:hypothetical protein
MPAFEAVVLAAQEDEQADRPVARLAHCVLRSTLEMLSSRESRDTDEHQRSGSTAPRG